MNHLLIVCFYQESEWLKFSAPENAAARTQVLDYFHQLKLVIAKDHILFKFDKTNLVSRGEKKFIDEICLHMGFKRSLEANYICGTSSMIIDHYPEIAYIRDLVFMFKLMMVPTSDKLPELKSWEPDEVSLVWSPSGSNEETSYVVKGFGKVLDCVSITSSSGAAIGGGSDPDEELIGKRRGVGFGSMMMRIVGLATTIHPRSLPSQANPSILLGENVDTEDDILHVKHLPDFDNSIGAKDCELLLQYLTAPYLRIPLLLNFFGVEGRLKALRSKALQEVLDAAIFEPGQWREEVLIDCPTTVPAPDRKHLCTAAGLLFNEIIMSPNVILTSVVNMLEKVIDMDTGKYSEIGDSFLYIVRLAVRIEGYLLFLTRNYDYWQTQHQSSVSESPSNNGRLNGAGEFAFVRGLDDVTEDVIVEAKACQRKLRATLDDKIFSIIARWTKRSKKDGLVIQACMLHAHLAFLYRNVDPQDLNPRVVFTILASQIFLFNNFKYDLDATIEPGKTQKSRSEIIESGGELIIPQLELFDMYQRNRAMILNWLVANPSARNTVHELFPTMILIGIIMLSFVCCNAVLILCVLN